MTMQHTPWPWHRDSLFDLRIWGQDERDGTIQVGLAVNETEPYGERTRQRTMANARLLVLAPTTPHACSPDCPGEQNRRKLEAFDDLLKACQAVLSLSADIYAIGVSNSVKATSSERDLWRVQEQVSVAIAKAEGRTP